MRFLIDGVPIYFPYEKIYPEQLKYIKSLLKSIQTPGHVLIEMPSGTGKTVALLSCTVSYQLHMKAKGVPFKIVYCSRTLPEIDKALKELRSLVEYIKKHVSFDFLGVGLSKRGNMCINKEALGSFDVEITCRKMTNHFENMKCDFYENKATSIPYGVYDFTEIKELGAKMGVCPYFFVRNHLPLFDCIIYPYNYLIEPSIFSIISKELPKDSFVVFDEAHNIDSHCIEALSIEISRNTLEAASRIMSVIESKIKSKKQEIDRRLRKEYELMFKTMEYTGENTIPHFFNTNKPELAPGNLRNASHFVSVMKRLIEFLKTKLKTTHLTVESIKSFIQSIKELTFIDKKTLSFVSQRMGIMVQSLGVEDDELYKLLSIANFGTMLSIYSKGFSVIFEPYDTMSGVFNPVLRLSCLDASIAMSHVFKNFRNVIITSGTLSPIEMYPKILNFVPSSIVEIGITLCRNSTSPLIITKGDDQMLLKNSKDDEYEMLEMQKSSMSQADGKITTSFALRADPSVVRNYGNLITSLSKIVPDNIVVFFPSYIYMEEVITLWSESNVMEEILQSKLVFIETPDFRETETALRNYRKACDMGRGAVLFSVARGKVSEGVDFEHGYGRAVVMLGVPFMYTESVRLKERLKYMRQEHGIKEYEFLVFDAMRHAAQCLGRVLRNKTDYGLMIMADQRFGAQSKISKMPKWIQERIEKGNCGLSIDMALSIAKMFYKEMAQPVSGDGVALLDEKDIDVYLKKM
ncbi:DNA repair helicase (rad3) [Vittaforma corneae ATCC 50505]|uniref:DNA 5'-3' helicase n=1 Tax=Vittaforma corneae (strain ATCC 50505) TaxID=993615 RepID=L2GQA7_VITCO|nr:DNA repair helicase (rad3) [Vittaforma corneae ATCC 50505]ELA42799.1 DNA repair helicase (rad3) [Vittaforma corneae ATCC 50505]